MALRKYLAPSEILYFKNLLTTKLNDLDPDLKIFRFEKVSLLVALTAKEAGVCPFGIPEDVHQETYYVTYTSEDDLELAIGATLTGFIIKSSEIFPKLLGSLTSFLAIGKLEVYEKWLDLLEELDLPEATWVKNSVQEFLELARVPGLPKPVDLNKYTLPKNSEEWLEKYRVYEKALKKPFYLYALPWSGFEEKEVLYEETPLEELLEENPLPILDEPAKEVSLKVGASTAGFANPFDFLQIGPPLETLDEEGQIKRILKKIWSMKPEPTSLIVTNPSMPYVTLGALDDLREQNKAFKNQGRLSKKEIDLLIKHFSYVKGMNYFKALDKVREEGFDLAIEYIEGHEKVKFPNADPKRIRVSVKDLKPITKVCPSPQGKISEILGLVGY